MCTRIPAALADRDRLVDRVEQASAFVADVRGVDSAVPRDDLGQLDQLGRPGVPAGHVDQAGREPPGAALHRRSTSCFIRVQLGRARRSSALPMTLDRTDPCGIRWITLVPAPWASIAAKYLATSSTPEPAVAGDDRGHALGQVVPVQPLGRLGDRPGRSGCAGR